MEARLNYDEIQFWIGIIELITPIDFIKKIEMTDEFENSQFVPEEYLERLKTLFESIVDPGDYKYERREELFNKFITRIKINRRLCIEWKELNRDINLEFYKMRRRQETAQIKKKEAKAAPEGSKKKESNQSAEHFRQRVFTSSKINRREEVEEQEEVELTDMEEYDLTGTGEPVYETPIMTPQLCRRIMANEFSQDQVEYIIKKSLKF